MLKFSYSLKHHCSIIPTEAPEPPIPTVQSVDLSSGNTRIITSPQEPTTTSTEEPIYEGSGEVPKSVCRGDDEHECGDGSKIICGDQVCDGVSDCDDGGDEKNCPNSGKPSCSVVTNCCSCFCGDGIHTSMVF